MFTGIIEAMGEVAAIRPELDNLHFTLRSPISDQLAIDQSVCHDGVCLTVVALEAGAHTVTAVAETLRRSRLADWRVGSRINLERSLRIGDRLDGHLVQGHTDATAECVAVEETGGSWRFDFAYPPEHAPLLVDKGSVCLNGVSLTVVNPTNNRFSVAIIPYTWEHTNFRFLQPGSRVNVEFDVIGKYTLRNAEFGMRNAEF